MKDYYKILEISRTATQEEIKKAYHKLAHQYHPDFNNTTERVKKLAEDKFKELQEAYDVLGNPDKRRQYDAKLNEFGQTSANKKSASEGFSGSASQPINTTKSAKRKNYWIGVITSVVIITVVRLAVSASSPPGANTDTPTTSLPQSHSSLDLPSDNKTYANTTDATQNTTVNVSQFPTDKCVTESGVQICDLSYNVTGQVGDTRTIKIRGNEIICHDLTTDTNTDVQSETVNINSDPQFCASDYGAVYIDPSIYVTKHFDAIQVTNGTYTFPATAPADCLWTYAGGSGDIPYISISGSGGPDSSYYSVRAFCQNGANQMDL